MQAPTSLKTMHLKKIHDDDDNDDDVEVNDGGCCWLMWHAEALLRLETCFEVIQFCASHSHRKTIRMRHKRTSNTHIPASTTNTSAVGFGVAVLSFLSMRPLFGAFTFVMGNDLVFAPATNQMYTCEIADYSLQHAACFRSKTPHWSRSGWFLLLRNTFFVLIIREY